MRIQNNTPHIFVHGNVQIAPGASGELPDTARERLAHFFANRRLVEIVEAAPVPTLKVQDVEEESPPSTIDTLEGLLNDVGDEPPELPEKPAAKRGRGRPKKEG